MAFYPAFRLQESLQRNTLGDNAWKNIMVLAAKRERAKEFIRERGKPPPESTWGKITRMGRKRRELDFDDNYLNTGSVSASGRKSSVKLAKSL
jgi:hypothetical protein